MNFASDTHRQALVDNLKSAITHAEELLRAAEGDGLEKSQEIRANIQERIRQARQDLGQLQDSAMGRAKAGCRATDAFVRQSPWQSAGIAAGAGLLVGLLLARR